MAILNLTIESVLDVATEAQGLWQRGTIGRYHVVEYFIDGIFDLHLKNGFENGTGNINGNYLEEKLSRIRVLTTGRTKPEATEVCLGDGSCLCGNRRWYEYSYRYSHHLRSPTNMKELKELLIQTTWM